MYTKEQHKNEDFAQLPEVCVKSRSSRTLSFKTNECKWKLKKKNLSSFFFQNLFEYNSGVLPWTPTAKKPITTYQSGWLWTQGHGPRICYDVIPPKCLAHLFTVIFVTYIYACGGRAYLRWNRETKVVPFKMRGSSTICTKHFSKYVNFTANNAILLSVYSVFLLKNKKVMNCLTWPKH